MRQTDIINTIYFFDIPRQWRIGRWAPTQPPPFTGEGCNRRIPGVNSRKSSATQTNIPPALMCPLTRQAGWAIPYAPLLGQVLALPSRTGVPPVLAARTVDSSLVRPLTHSRYNGYTIWIEKLCSPSPSSSKAGCSCWLSPCSTGPG